MALSQDSKDSVEFGAWKERARALATTHATVNDFSAENLRRVLVQLNGLFLSSTGPVLKAYRAMADGRIAGRERKFTDALATGSIAWTLPDGLEEIAETIGGLIRAVDWTLGQYRSQWPKEPSQWIVDNCYVIPRDSVSTARSLSQTQPYQRRGLVFHRIIPKEIDGYAVEVFNGRTLHCSAADKSNWKMGACLFEELKLDTDVSEHLGEKRFVVKGANSPYADAVVEEQITKCLDEECVAVVWPELAVPPKLRGRIKALLQDRDVADDRLPPEVVVAGTWHEATKEGVVNRALVFDGYGIERLVYDKIAPFSGGGWGKEDITPGTKLCVLATEAAIIGFAICLDFCDADAETNPFTKMDIDLMLIPSMGNDQTMEGHQTTAAQMGVKFGTRTFVVQHITDTEFKDGRIGAILPMPKRPNKVPIEQLGQKTVWNSYRWPQAT
ncbi:hypothetical protein [Bradyrhizobium sp. BWC-3-1]|uniref:hypothetical protein n=1 Tax=Bradyrhizobium sp. BWC-3-1 TaxID=3080012 RepID=UPI00293F3B07|nr:hypothetical protein [Bradyrhizobium sp. BWC-3-1]WOH57800.1 hypothetical protein RX329_37615 [Bradyrhizobium sp. BWC-3-1]